MDYLLGYVITFAASCFLAWIAILIQESFRSGFHDGGYVLRAEQRKNEESFVTTDGQIVRYGRRRVDRMQAEVNALRNAIRLHDTEATEAAWDEMEEWLDLSMLSRITTAEGMK